MPLNPQAILNRRFPPVRQELTPRDVMLYGLSLGLGRDPQDSIELAWVFEKSLRPFPTFAGVLGHPGHWMTEPELGITRAKVVHGGMRLSNLRPLPIGGAVVSENRVSRIVDKGADKGSLIVLEKTVRDEAQGEIISVAESLIYCRADGGFGGDPTFDDGYRPCPDRPPDASISFESRPEAALIYRLNGDYNPLHADPEAARIAGFDRPIIHGLYTWGVAAVGLLKLFGEDGGRELKTFGARFSRPAFPGETIAVDLWRSSDEFAFRARVPERDVVVLDRGHATLSPAKAVR